MQALIVNVEERLRSHHSTDVMVDTVYALSHEGCQECLGSTLLKARNYVEHPERWAHLIVRFCNVILAIVPQDSTHVYVYSVRRP
jgi:hypothetical protein